MSDGKEKIFSAVKEALSGLPSKTPLPEYDDAFCVSEARLKEPTPWANFAANFQAVNGKAMTQVSELSAFLKENAHTYGYCDPALKDTVGAALEQADLKVVYEYERDQHDQYKFGITRASGVIAESGSVILNDHLTSDRLAALSPWVHVAVLSDANLIHRTIPDALATLGDCPNVIWATGPSKTADVEGILIEGVHGPGEEICLCLAEV